MLTGISLIDRAVLVVLSSDDDSYRPISLGVPGTYDRLGSIDSVQPDTNTVLVTEYFHDRLRDGRFVVHPTEWVGDPPFAEIEELLYLFERNELVYTGMGPPVAELDGALIVFALFAERVWNRLCANTRSSRESGVDVFRRVFGTSSPADEIYRGRISDVDTELRELAKIGTFIAERAMSWAPAGEVSQRYPTEMRGQYHEDDAREFLREARLDYHDCPAVLAGLDEHERDIEEYFETG
ncbi:hypothetical protein [Antrihabitans spumae]|uniref:Uncharacterized protein n=1 Tax=Antrihabitans spumae TaxID=3373370 RepID=A0ABW7K4D3_9NOCA